MPHVPLFLIEKAAGMNLEAALPELISRRLDHRQVSALCDLYRRVAICRLLATGAPGDFFIWLAMGAQAFLHWLEGVPEDRKVLSYSRPFFDAVACGADELAAAIAGSAGAKWRQGQEYEEDFLYFRFLMSHGALHAARPECATLLERFDALAEGEDPRADVCRGLFERDQEKLDGGLERLLLLWDTERRERVRQGLQPADDEATVDKVSVELLALLRIIQAGGLAVDPDHRLAPSVARRLDLARLPPPGAWRELPSFRVLG